MSDISLLPGSVGGSWSLSVKLSHLLYGLDQIRGSQMLLEALLAGGLAPGCSVLALLASRPHLSA